MPAENHGEPWKGLTALLEQGDQDALRDYLRTLPPGETGRVVSRLTQQDQERLLTLPPPAEVADLITELSPSHAAELLRLLPPAGAAAILGKLPNDEQADLLAELGPEQAEAILQALAPEVAERVRRLAAYPPDTAGGLMITEYLAYPDSARVGDIVDDLRGHASDYSQYELQYIYITSPNGELLGVLRLRDILLAPSEASAASLMIASPRCVRTRDRLVDLARFFDRYPFFGAPVIDVNDRLVGVVLRADAEEALGAQAERRFLLASGVLGGEEFRTMPWLTRLGRRLAWLAISLCLSLLGAAVIGLYEETLAAAIALAAFLPVISGTGGNSGNQALAVSVRELALGLIQPRDFSWVLRKELGVSVINGLLLGTALGTLAAVWKANVYLGLVVGTAMMLNTTVAACLGGIVPLALRRFDLDPAVATGPVLTTFNDICGFFFALSFASMLLR